MLGFMGIAGLLERRCRWLDIERREKSGEYVVGGE